jgi:peptidoglycan/xylan/chitin deacetylase (PgdA/CDA1 family)
VATVSVTFDNLGEAAELERGDWPEGQPLGEHFSVRECLPQLLGMLAGEDLHGTFFVEGLNGELYPQALAGLAAAGHEVACHGWRHERWSEVEDERALLERAGEALGGPVGFRPPGGQLGAGGAGVLAELGYRYCSPPGERAGRMDGVAVLPYRWAHVDACFYVPGFGELRDGDPDAAMGPASLREAMLAALDAHAGADEHLTLVFHPFMLTADPDAPAALAAVLARVGELQRAGALRCVRMDAAAEALPADAGPPSLDETSWAG